MIKECLQLTRAHTTPLEAAPALIGGLIATGGDITSSVILFAVVGILYHNVGYAMNSWLDWKGGYDKNDPNKQHHPLNNGSIKPLQAKWFVRGSFVLSLLFVLFVYIDGGVSSNTLLSLAIVCVGVLGGLAYNIWGKETNLKSVPISIAHTTVFAAAYTYCGGSNTVVLSILSLYVFVWVLYQIGVSGEMKDIMQDESNLLIDIGVESDGESIFMPHRANFIVYSLDLVMFIVGVVAIDSTGGGPVSFVTFVVFMALRELMSSQLTSGGEYDRESRMRTMSIVEALSLMGFITIASGRIGAVMSVSVAFVSVIWVVAFNKIEWGTLVAPKV